MPGTSSYLISPDVAIVGGGVAGSSLAAVLARSGFDVVVIEREPRFRDRVRGEGLHPWGVKEAERLGLLPVLRAAGANELIRWRDYVQREAVGTIRWDDDQPGWPGEWGISHPAMQDALLAHARDSGARVLRPARIIGFSRPSEPELSVAAEGREYVIRPRLLVGADGRQSMTRRWVGGEVVRDPVHHQVGGCLLDGVALDDDASHFGAFEGGFVLVFPQGRGRVRAYVICHDSIAATMRGHAHIDQFIAQCSAVYPEGAFAEARPAGPLAFFPNADIWASKVAGDRVVLIGDAAGANDPSRGHGLSITFRDVRELRDWLLAEPDWGTAIAGYASRRAAYYEVLRVSGQWAAMLSTEIGPEADARRARASLARKRDRHLGGFGARIIARGPDGLVADDTARRRYFGEDLHSSSPVSDEVARS
jgi:menaquinone-9 beta-reductase